MTVLMLSALVTTVLGSVLLGRSASLLVRRLRPGLAVPFLVVASVAVALGHGAAWVATGLAVAGRLEPITGIGGWSPAVLRSEIPLPGWLEAVAAVVGLALLARAGAVLVRTGRHRRDAARLVRSLDPGPDRLVVLEESGLDAFSVAAGRGCVVITRPLLSCLDEADRRVVLAHEYAHLRRRHALLLQLVAVAVAADPLLRAVPAAVALGVERWADEDAARVTNDRRAAGLALARVALVVGRSRRTTAGLAAAGTHVTERVRALMDPAPRAGRLRSAVHLGVGIALAGVVLALGVVSLHQVHEVFELAGNHPPTP